MKQCSIFFAPPPAHQPTAVHHEWAVYTDGASRGNPGPSGAGIYIVSPHKKRGSGIFLGTKTNNQAEYFALIFGLYTLERLLKKHPTSHRVTVIADSELLVRQMRGEYQVRDATLKMLKEAAELLIPSGGCSFRHVLREHNKDADEQANAAIDKKRKPPAMFMRWLRSKNVVL